MAYRRRFFFVRYLISESLSFDAFQRIAGALRITYAKLCAVVEAEVELCKVAVQVLAIHVLVRADQSTLEDRKEAFQRVGVNITARPLVLGMVH